METTYSHAVNKQWKPWNMPLFPGWNLTLITQFAPGPRLLGQLLVWLNGLATLMWLAFRTPAPEFVEREIYRQ